MNLSTPNENGAAPDSVSWFFERLSKAGVLYISLACSGFAFVYLCSAFLAAFSQNHLSAIVQLVIQISLLGLLIIVLGSRVRQYSYSFTIYLIVLFLDAWFFWPIGSYFSESLESPMVYLVRYSLLAISSWAVMIGFFRSTLRHYAGLWALARLFLVSLTVLTLFLSFFSTAVTNFFVLTTVELIVLTGAMVFYRLFGIALPLPALFVAVGIFLQAMCQLLLMLIFHFEFIPSPVTAVSAPVLFLFNYPAVPLWLIAFAFVSWASKSPIAFSEFREATRHRLTVLNSRLEQLFFVNKMR